MVAIAAAALVCGLAFATPRQEAAPPAPASNAIPAIDTDQRQVLLTDLENINPQLVTSETDQNALATCIGIQFGAEDLLEVT